MPINFNGEGNIGALLKDFNARRIKDGFELMSASRIIPRSFNVAQALRLRAKSHSRACAVTEVTRLMAFHSGSMKVYPVPIEI